MKKTCFVIMGFQTKKIPNTNMSINLDETYQYLIKPVLIKSGLISVYSQAFHKHAFRCDEIYTTQSINETFMKNLYFADIVIADISALNQNAIYELGMRHAMKPKSTIIMCDQNTWQSNSFFDLTFNPQIIYDSEKQKEPEEIRRVSEILSNIIEICKESDDTYIDSPVFRMGIYDQKPMITSDKANSITLREELANANQLLEGEKYIEAEIVFEKILNEYSYISDDVICSYVLAAYKKNLSIENLSNALNKLKERISLNNTTCEDALGIAAAIHLRLFNIRKKPSDLYAAIEYYREGSNYESGNIYCARNYCSSLLKIYLIEADEEILREYYYAAKHNARIFLTKAQTLERKSDSYNNAWFLSNLSDLKLISDNTEQSNYNIVPTTQRQETTILQGRTDLISDLKNIKQKIGINE